ncbi:hypothetical protein ACR78Z_00950 [Sphingobacterium thalpophilum]|uniref:Uncharacterized protein n=1 Tax=Sphingobacterium thalpophilum TaxID=259 RepID=A0A4U9UB11_9SPHI|nr:hypothetical protein [Sphingobacterium thalpophilum]VTR28592.1 Uncharacterised protein [Sphingobacterium thalpophilum]
MLHKTFILICLICALTICCSPQKVIERAGSRHIELTEGQESPVKGSPIRVKFKGISEDSRCPQGANCIWAGVAVAQIEIRDQSAEPVILDLATTDLQQSGYQKSAIYKSYSFSLLSVDPYPTQQHAVHTLKGKYKIAITVQKQ